MARYYNGQPIELLAPAGTFEIFESVIRANCDAVYFGGSILNMRMIRKGYNFSNEEIKKAVETAHQLNKKVYVTVNNLFSHEDLDAAIDYLNFLESVQPDALIIQDFALFQLAKELNLTLELHSSVMMNVHNLATIEKLETLGVTRVVTSREMSLEEITALKAKTTVAFEYFVHGDMCVSHGAQCIYSGMLFGMSSNRGRCLKPCRWSFDIEKDGQLYKPGFPLAVKDMCLYEHLPELIASGVTSFKMEGRMRDKEFITDLINLYGDAIDRFIASPESYDRSLNFEQIYDKRKRDLSSGYAFGKPGLSNINTRYEGTGKFYSTGKVFSTPTEETELSLDRINTIQNAFDAEIHHKDTSGALPELSVKVNTMDQAMLCLKKNIQHLYLSMDVFLPDTPFTLEDIRRLINQRGRTSIYITLPKMMTEVHFEQFDHWFMDEKLPVHGIVFTSLGTLHRYGGLGYKMIGDTSLNVYNYKAAQTYQDHGAHYLSPSLELPLKDMIALLKNSETPLELYVHGMPTVLYLEHDLYENTTGDDNGLVLKTPAGEYPVYKDQHGRNHMTTAKELCYLPLIKTFIASGLSRFRIEGTTYSTARLGHLIDSYQHAISNGWAEDISLPTVTTTGYTLGALTFD